MRELVLFCSGFHSAVLTLIAHFQAAFDLPSSDLILLNEHVSFVLWHESSWYDWGFTLLFAMLREQQQSLFTKIMTNVIGLCHAPLCPRSRLRSCSRVDSLLCSHRIFKLRLARCAIRHDLRADGQQSASSFSLVELTGFVTECHVLVLFLPVVARAALGADTSVESSLSDHPAGHFDHVAAHCCPSWCVVLMIVLNALVVVTLRCHWLSGLDIKEMAKQARVSVVAKPSEMLPPLAADDAEDGNLPDDVQEADLDAAVVADANATAAADSKSDIPDSSAYRVVPTVEALDDQRSATSDSNVALHISVEEAHALGPAKKGALPPQDDDPEGAVLRRCCDFGHRIWHRIYGCLRKRHILTLVMLLLGACLPHDPVTHAGLLTSALMLLLCFLSIALSVTLGVWGGNIRPRYRRAEINGFRSPEEHNFPCDPHRASLFHFSSRYWFSTCRSGGHGLGRRIRSSAAVIVLPAGCWFVLCLALARFCPLHTLLHLSFLHGCFFSQRTCRIRCSSSCAVCRRTCLPFAGW